MARAYTVEKLGPKRSLTPEGFLICHDVPVARTGDMLYGRGEVPVQTGNDGFIRVTRTADDLFSDTSLSSCEGKPVTFRHPPGLKVTPDNYAAVTKGHMGNARRGEGANDDVILADLTIYDKPTIDAIRDNRAEEVSLEVSLGYEATYQQTAPGKALQTNIVVNHVAIVPKGRCGPRCAIGDEESTMNWFEKLKARLAEKIRTGDAEGAAALITEAESERVAELASATGDAKAVTLDADTKALIEKLVERVGVIEAANQARATADAAAEEARKQSEQTIATADEALVSLYPASRIQDIASKAEILSPGFKMPTVDATATADCAHTMCSCQRNALSKAYAGDTKAKEAIDSVLAGRSIDFDKADAATIDGLFNAAAAIRAAQNNAITVGGQPKGYEAPKSPAQQLQENAEALWQKQA